MQYHFHVVICSFYFQGTSPGSEAFLDNIRDNLNQETLELDRLKLNMSAGARLLKEKEEKLKLIENSLMEVEIQNTELL